jgi:hypothetical protein
MPVYEVVDPGGALTRELLTSLANPRSGRIVCDVLPNTERLETLGAAMLFGLGRSASLPGVPRNAHRKWDRVRAWVHAESISDVFVFPCDAVHGALHEWLFTLCADGPVTLWLMRENAMPTSEAFIDQRKRAGVEAAFRARRRVSIEQLAPQDFVQHWSGAIAGREAAEEPSPWPLIPHHGFVWFLDRASVELDRDAFHRVRAAWRRGYDLTVARLADGMPPSEEEHAPFIRELCSFSASYREMVCVLRGSQAAYFVEGDALLRINPDRLAAHLANASLHDLSAGAAQRLRGFICPARAAASLIRLVSHAEPGEIAAMTIRDIAQDGSGISVAGHRHSIPAHARALVRAQHFMRTTIDKGGNDDALLVYDVPGGRAAANPKVVVRWLRDATLMADVPLVSHYVHRDAPDHKRWMFRRGFSLQPLETN